MHYIVQLFADSEDIHKNFTSTLVFNVRMVSIGYHYPLLMKIIKYEKELYRNHLKLKIEKEILIFIQNELNFINDENVVFIVIGFLGEKCMKKKMK